MPHNHRLNRSEEIRPKAVGGGIFDRLYHKCWSSADLVDVDVDVRAKFGDSMLNNGRIIRLFGRTSVQYIVTFYSRLETASGVVSGKFVEPILPDKRVKYRGPRLIRSRKIPPEAVGGGIFDIFSG